MIKCKTCGMTFTSNERLKRHRRKAHPKRSGLGSYDHKQYWDGRL